MTMERFEDRGAAYGIRILNCGNGIIAINPQFNDDKAYVEMYFDVEKQEVGLRILAEKTDYSYRLSKAERQASYYIFARRFFRNFGIDKQRQVFTKDQIREEDGLLIFGPVKMKTDVLREKGK